MKTITKTDELIAFCEAAKAFDYVTIDTEFLRERTYYSKLCLIQLAVPGKGDDHAVLVDPLAHGLKLDALYALFEDETVVKVFHAARQDLEIFCVDAGVLPKPLFDTQVAAMVCGFGEQVGYETLVRKITKNSIDKSSRFTDWSRRPLTEAQKSYALADVTHLRQVYEFLRAKIEKTGRGPWVEEELQILTNPETYRVRPSEAWRRVKTRTSSPRVIAVVQALADFREDYAQTRNVPRSRVFKDDALIELASTKPTSMEELGRARLLLREARKGDIASGILKAINAALALPKEDLPAAPAQDTQAQTNPALADLLRVLLKAKAENIGVAAKLIAATSELDALAMGRRDVASLKGWRLDVFGDEALKLCKGEIALVADGSMVKTIPVLS